MKQAGVTTFYTRSSFNRNCHADVVSFSLSLIKGSKLTKIRRNLYLL